MNNRLPDVAKSEASTQVKGLDWVGMQGIVMPMKLDDKDVACTVQATVNVEINLPHSGVKGIHMSRLYVLLDTFAETSKINQHALSDLLHEFVHSHRDCAASNARITIDLNVLHKRKALLSPGLSGWRSYPIKLEASLINGHFTSIVQVTVTYSSTCPCSAALSRQLVSDAFSNQFSKVSSISPSEVSIWLNEHASLATPHSQRSLAIVSVQLPKYAMQLGILKLINQIEDSLQTPVQTAVKRIDEQAFARLNGANLMYVEDAARRIYAALSNTHQAINVQVRHLESLHPHDAVAEISGLSENHK
jgi:GTP cyclohydrolase I